MDRLKELYNGKNVAYCRICGMENELTRDHFPPYAVGNSNRISISSGKNHLILQNGMKFRTICYRCNNDLLSVFDKEQVNLKNEFSNYQKDIRIYNSEYIGVKINTYRLLRSVLGHYIAVCLGDNVKEILSKPLEISKFYEEMRSFVLGRIFSLDITNVYYWYYPYNDIRFCQFEAYIPNFSQGNRNPIYGGLIKYYPLAYWIVDGSISKPIPNYEKMKVVDSTKTLKIRSNIIREQFVIESPDTNSAILMSTNGRIEAKKDK